MKKTCGFFTLTRRDRLSWQKKASVFLLSAMVEAHRELRLDAVHLAMFAENEREKEKWERIIARHEYQEDILSRKMEFV